MTDSGPVRVAVVDDDAVTRTGTTALLATSSRIEVVLTCSHAEAFGMMPDWPDVDVLIVDAADDRDQVDHFPGARLVQRLRGLPQGRDLTVIVITGHFLDDALRLRMREARADFFYSRLDLRSEDALVRAVLKPDAARRVPAARDPETLRQLGITPRSSLSRLIEHAEEADLSAVLSEDRSAENLPSSRSRWWTRLRHDAAAAGGIGVVNVDGTLPRRDQATPSLAQIRRVYSWATRIKDPR